MNHPYRKYVASAMKKIFNTKKHSSDIESLDAKTVVVPSYMDISILDGLKPPTFSTKYENGIGQIEITWEATKNIEIGDVETFNRICIAAGDWATWNVKVTMNTPEELVSCILCHKPKTFLICEGCITFAKQINAKLIAEQEYKNTMKELE